ncbi:hypothetical protein GWI33_013458 [Rhynchophorus ferrugineus]|uniref:Uncharacterized protein n=1 Tax=Rhynchophorus ferrugineus TaxID=354439 RepID=A0A834MBK2_RHYFE|nr:hypothetical protein GWI33_013458 [Rhynchophorus ferrugineus]
MASSPAALQRARRFTFAGARSLYAACIRDTSCRRPFDVRSETSVPICRSPDFWIPGDVLKTREKPPVWLAAEEMSKGHSFKACVFTSPLLKRL